MPTPAHYETLASGEAALHGLPVSVRSLLDNLPGAHRLALVNALVDARTPASSEDQLPFLRGRVAGLIESAELRGDLTSGERSELMLFALGAPAAKDEWSEDNPRHCPGPAERGLRAVGLERDHEAGQQSGGARTGDGDDR